MAAAARPRRVLPDLIQMSPWRGVWAMGIPGMARSFLAAAIQITNLIVVGHLGPDAIAAVGIANRFLFLLIAVLQSITVGTTALVARSIGAHDQQRTRQVIHQSILLSLGIGITLAIAGVLFAGPIVHALLVLEPTPDPRLQHEAVAYMMWSLGPMALGALSFTGTSIFQAAGDITTPLWVLTSADLLNLGLAYTLVYGLGPIHSMGVAGAGLASGVARCAAAVTCLLLLRSRQDAIRWVPAGLRVLRETIRDILQIGVPAGVESMLRQGSFILFTVVVAALGSAALAANQIAQSLQTIVFQIGFGFSMASTALVGQNLGAGSSRRAAASAYAANWVSLGLSVPISVLFFLFAKTAAHLYTPDPTVVDLAALCIQISAFGLVFNSISLVLAGGLRGAGDTTWVMYVTAGGTWFIRLGLSAVIGLVLGGGLQGVWIAVVLDQTVRGLLTVWRFRSGRWIEIFRRQEANRARRLGGRTATAAL